eukprot:Ihof_evm3s353 gene=Ihof_evmTU3s353
MNLPPHTWTTLSLLETLPPERLEIVIERVFSGLLDVAGCEQRAPMNHAENACEEALAQFVVEAVRCGLDPEGVEKELQAHSHHPWTASAYHHYKTEHKALVQCATTRLSVPRLVNVTWSLDNNLDSHHPANQSPALCKVQLKTTNGPREFNCTMEELQ